jgi:hypothetical protein
MANGRWCGQDLVEIEDWNEYGELKQHVTIYYDDFTQPTKAQAAAMPQPLRRGPVKPAATAKSAAKTTGTAAPPAPPMPEKKEKATETEGQKSVVDTVKDTAAKVTLPIRGIAEEAAAKAKDMRLQSLREKVYGKGGKPSEEGKVEGKNDTVTEPKGEEKKDTATEPKTEETEVTSEAKEEKEQGDTLVQNPAPIPIPSTPTKKSITSEPTDNLPQGPVGMQSPTTGAWKHGASTDDFLRTLQSPTSTSWKPTDVDEPITCYRGSVVQTVSEAEIKAIEKAEMIEEEPEAEEEAEAEEKEEEEEEKDEEDEEEEEDDDEEEEDDDEEDDDDEEEEGAQAEKKPEEVEAHEKK